MAVTAGYIASQQKRYNDAIKANDKDLIGRLEADAKRASYALTKPSAPAKAVAPTPSVKTPKALGASLADVAKSAIASTVDKLKTDAATANAKLATSAPTAPTPTLEVFKNAVTPTPTVTPVTPLTQPTVKAPTSTYSSSVAQGIYTPLTPTPVQTVAPVAPKVETPAPMQVTTPAPTRPSLEQEVGQLPYTPTPTATPTPRPMYQDFVRANKVSAVLPVSNPVVEAPKSTPLPQTSIFNIAPVAPVAPKVEPALPTYPKIAPTANTQTSLEKEAGQLSYTPTLDIFKQAATPKYTTDMLNVPQTDLEKQVGLTPYVPSPVAPIAQATQTPLEQEAKLFETYTPPTVVPQAPTFKDFVEANKQSVVTSTDRVETPTLPATFAETVKTAPTPTPTPVVEDKAPVQTVETLALPNDTRKRVMGETFTFDNYKNFLDSFQNASELSPEERAWLDGARQQIFSNYDFLTQEMARTQNVIMDRLNKGLDITDQENYYNRLTKEEMKFVKQIQASIPHGMKAEKE